MSQTLAIIEELERVNKINKKQEEYKDLIQRYRNSFILDFNEETKEPLIEVNSSLVKFLKPHQKNGIKFLYDSIIGTIDQLDHSKGSGAILAHSMGLGKTLQVITFVQTILTHTDIKKTIKRVLVICPKNTIKNWVEEFNKWLKNNNLNDVLVFEMYISGESNRQRIQILECWNKTGGVLIIGLTLFSSLVLANKPEDVKRKYLLDPDIVVIDEGQLIKNRKTTYYRAVSQIKTQRRIVLTGTPIQNNLLEYYFMISFVKPNLLGNKQHFKDYFVDPITNGQNEDSEAKDVQVMNETIHNLQTLLDGFVHRYDYNILVPELKPKYEYVLSVKLTKKQIELYSYYLENVIQEKRSFLIDYGSLRHVWNHPSLLYEQHRRRKKKNKKSNAWFKSLVEESNQIEMSGKFILMFAILEKCQQLCDKLLIFTQSLDILDLIEKILEIQTKSEIQSNVWIKNKDYFRIDGSTSSDCRKKWINVFNDENNDRARLFLISTKAGGLGINLVGANRCIIFDASWNPTHDVQAIYRIFRFGQKKAVYVYRFIAQGTMEEKIYKRQIEKLALSLRVIDNMSIDRHFRTDELLDLYLFNPDTSDDRTEQKPPKDRLLADILLNHNFICEYHEHDSLLQHKPREQLTENEKKAVWNHFKHNNYY